MKNITQLQAYNRMFEYSKDVCLPEDLPKNEKEFILSELCMFAVLGTNFQEGYVDDWILHLIKDAKSKL